MFQILIRPFAVLAIFGLLMHGLGTSDAAAGTDVPLTKSRDQWCENSLWRDVRVPPVDDEPLPHLKVLSSPGNSPEDLIYSLALSGGGYRAMLFHIGTLRRLNDAGLLSKLTLVSSVSGGSITAAYLAYKWNSLIFDSDGKAINFESEIESPIRKLGRTTIDIPSGISGLLSANTTAQELAKRLDIELFSQDQSKRAMLLDIAPGGSSLDGHRPRPVFAFVATSLQTAEMWQFRALAMGGPQVGWTSSTGVGLAEAVAASAGFPPVFASMKLDLSDRNTKSDWHECSEERDVPFGIDHRNSPSKVIGIEKLPEFRRTIVLADGGIRDNLGVAVVEETNRVRLLRAKGSQPSTATFISDGGASSELDSNPASNWWSILMRVTSIMSDEPSDVRVANLIRTGSLTLLRYNGFQNFTNNGCLIAAPDQAQLLDREIAYRSRTSSDPRDEYAYWSIRRMPKYHLNFGCPAANSRLEDEVRALSQVATRMASMDDALQARLINWGYLAAHQGIPYIDRLSAREDYLLALRASCSMPYGKQVVDPKGETPSARDTVCFFD